MDSPAQPWYKRTIAAWAFGASAAGFLFAATAIPVSFLLYRQDLRTMDVFSFACFPLALAGLLLTVLSASVPSLVSGNTMRFPLNLTLPSLYSGLVATSSLLMSNFVPPIALIGGSPRIDQIWGRADFIVSAWLVQIVAASIWAALAGRKKDHVT